MAGWGTAPSCTAVAAIAATAGLSLLAGPSAAGELVEADGQSYRLVRDFSHLEAGQSRNWTLGTW